MLGAPPEDAPPLDPIISSGGYVAPLPDRRWLVGSTYLGDEELEGRTERDARDQLREHVGRITPAVERTTSVDVWRGTRTHLTDDHLPTVGDVPGYHGRVFVLGALGSKGLLRAPLLASRLAESLLVSPAQKYENSSLSRLSDMRWFSPRLTQSEPGLEADRG
jgi:glycine/D-amino acid oxidase-like deaminating enzyme